MTATRSPIERASLARLWLTGLRDFLLPAACAVCRGAIMDADSGVICRTCWSRVVPLAPPLCNRCGHPRLSAFLPKVRPGNSTAPIELPPCRWCERLPAYVRSVRSWCRMDAGTGAAMVHALKYGGWPVVAPAMAARMARLRFPADVVAERTAVAAVPLSTVRYRERGYNQAGELARALAALWNVPDWTHFLRRTRHTKSQVQLTPSERAHNVSNAFTVVPGTQSELAGAHLVLVDDVITTASTLNAAAAALAEGGVRIISYVSFGRAPDPGARTDFDSNE